MWRGYLSGVLLAIGLLAFGIGIAVSSPLQAAHKSDNRVSSMEVGPGSGLDEFYCARIVAPSSTTFSAAKAALATALTGGGSSDYHGLNGNKVYFVQDAFQCPGSGSADGHSARYHFRNTWSDVPPFCTKNCVAKVGPFYWHNGTHFNYNSYDVFIRDQSVNNHTINHETGHVLGMADPVFGNCSSVSIMHSTDYGCSTDYAYPTSADRTTVTSNSQGN